MASLSVKTGDGEEQTLELAEDEVSFGRGTEVSHRLDDLKVSRKHCRVFKDKAAWSVQDLGSSNGTRINGVVKKLMPLKHGDRIEIGRTVIKYISAPAKKYAAPVRKTARERLRKKD